MVTPQELVSFEPATGEELWRGAHGNVDAIVAAARRAWPKWAALPLANRIELMRRFVNETRKDQDEFAELIARETGKPLWEARTEVEAVMAKVDISVNAYGERTGQRRLDSALQGVAALRHKPHGVMAVLGPYNFPAHLPNGHMIPALIAGNTVILKPSEKTPAVGEKLVELLNRSGIPEGVVQLLIGGPDEGKALVAHDDVNGVLFTGSAQVGIAINRKLATEPGKILALEMGGNNPLVVDDWDDLDAAVNVITRSAFISAGQRCTCTRRLFVPAGPEGDRLIDELVQLTLRLRIGAPGDQPEPFAGPVITAKAANVLRQRVDELVGNGAALLTEPGEAPPGTGFVRPTIVDVTGLDVADDEIFGPLLQVSRYDNFDQAVTMAADTDYGLAAGLISTNRERFEEFRRTVKAGVINWNTPTTGASGRLPFGGVGASGNHRPAGWSAADFCAYPVATMAAETVAEAAADIRGLE